MTQRTTRSMAGLTTTEVIRCLRDGSRDMTQVIYRQIPEMDIFDDNGSLRGTPLFRVNYCGDAFCHPIGSGKGRYDYSSGTQNWVNHHPKHDHLLWCIGDHQLFRCRVSMMYMDWPSHWTGLSRNRYYLVEVICAMYGISVPKNQGTLEVTVETPSASAHPITGIKRYHRNTQKYGPLTNGDKLIAALNVAYQQHTRTWREGQDEIMRLPQLYLTGLRR